MGCKLYVIKLLFNKLLVFSITKKKHSIKVCTIPWHKNKPLGNLEIEGNFPNSKTICQKPTVNIILNVKTL